MSVNYVSLCNMGHDIGKHNDIMHMRHKIYYTTKNFESYVSVGLQTRTTAFSCHDDVDDYDEDLLTSRPLPWVVRVFFESENSLSGKICSGKIFAWNFWK